MTADANPFIAPQDDSVMAPVAVEYGNLGGLTRGHYWLAILGMLVLAVIPLVGLLNLIISPVIACYRMKNVGYHPALGLLVLVPIANIWAGIICAAAPTGYRHSKKLDTTGKVIIAIFLAIFVLAILGAVLGGSAR